MKDMKEIQTNGITLLLVEVPEDASDFRIDYASIIVLSWATTNENGSIELSSGKWVILGKSTELSEEQMKGICEHCKMGYLNYKYPFSSNPSEAFTDNLQESYLSLLEANGIVDRNNLANHDTTTILGSSPSGIYYEVLDELRDKWQEAQSKVKHYLVLKRI